MITLPPLVSTETDVTGGSHTGKTGDTAQDFLTLLAGALGANDTPGKEVPLSFADLPTAGHSLQKGLLSQHGETSHAEKLADLLARQDLTADETLTTLTDAQQWLSTLTPTMKNSALTALNKSVQADDKTPALSDEDLANLSALFAMLPGQPSVTPVNSGTAPQRGDSLTATLRGENRQTDQEFAFTLPSGDGKKEKTDVVTHNAGTETGQAQPLTPLVVAATAKADLESSPSSVTPGLAMTAVSSPAAQPQPLPTVAAPVLSAPLGSHEWQQSLSQHITLFTRQGQQSAELRLHPEDLGQVQISLKLDDNQAQLQMVSAHSHVRAALEAALPVLRTQLAESGIQLGQSSISSESFSGQQHSSSQQQQTARAQGQESLLAEDDVNLAVPASLQNASRGNGAVDIFA
ncbi:flagellar hook-length control protein FliK [Citrobacter sp. NCU1]|uniref:flagellar hook length control protein FliK n=1 Tax=Citrobacter sp. NCU1 TaxID=2026683 RepID=UPI001390A40D|nr:flagellar hook length control protein FliK [Citrobacter sp. NCU1]NDO83201.1 flagellar hook-length control protein FliK [Citrobacter sp. NCU1]